MVNMPKVLFLICRVKMVIFKNHLDLLWMSLGGSKWSIVLAISLILSEGRYGRKVEEIFKDMERKINKQMQIH